MKFLDEAKIYISSGAGGAGCVSFRREKFIEFGGPDGGNGGRGSSIIFVGSGNLNTLIDFRYQQHFRGRTGGHGMGRNRAGKGADDIILPVPLGTEIIDDATGTVMADITADGQEFVALEGGRGGRGNASFVSSINRAPRQFTKGEPMREADVVLRLKLLADVGLLGQPNAGKSTFISRVSNARPKVADYPFTTLQPALGMVRHHGTDMVMADLPGLIEGASEGTGLGHRFLKHVARCSVLLHLVDGTQEDPAAAYATIRRELELYDEQFGSTLTSLPEVVALSKVDALDDKAVKKACKALAKACGRPVVALSSHSGAGLDDILSQLTSHVQTTRARRQAADQTSQSLEMPPSLSA